MRYQLAIIALLALAPISGCGRQDSPAPAPPVVHVWGEKGRKAGEFMGPRAIVVGHDGFVYVADRASRISKWTLDGKCVASWVAPVVNNGRFEGPEGIAMLPDGDLAVTNTHASRVLIYDTNGKLKRTFGSYGTQPGHFLLVTGICTDSDGYIYTADYGGDFDRISKWTKDGNLVAEWKGHGEGPRQFRRPCGLAISQSGDLLVADIANHRIQILDRKTGAYKGVMGTQGKDNGQLTYPYGVAVDGQGFIYTVEYSTHRVQKWTPAGIWVATWGGPGRKVGQLANPWGLSVAKDGTVYVADTENHRVQVFHFPP